MKHRSEDFLVVVHVDAAADAQKLLRVLGLGLLEGLQLDQQVGVLQIPGARGPDGLRPLPPTPQPPPALDRRTDDPQRGPRFPCGHTSA